MKKMFKENKILLVLGIIIIISLVLICVGLVSYFYGNDTSQYGNRLNGIENYKISEDISTQIKDKFTKGVSSVKVDVKGKIIYIIMDVDNGTSKIEAEGYAVKALEVFSEDILNYYDIQFMVTCNSEEEKEDMVYPIQGSRKAKSSTVTWTNN